MRSRHDPMSEIQRERGVSERSVACGREEARGDERGFCIAQLIVSGLACVIIPCPPAFGTGAGWLVLDEGEKDRVDGLMTVWHRHVASRTRSLWDR